VDGRILACSVIDMLTARGSRFRHADRHVYRNIAGEHLLVSIRGGSDAPIYALTPSGAALWKRLDRWATRDELIDDLLATYEVSRDRAADDVDEFLEQLRDLRALEAEETGG
jgi:hypothetical protein